jgi:hypothetical protein
MGKTELEEVITMKKLIVLVLLLVLPLSLFAQGFYLGVDAMFKGDYMELPSGFSNPGSIVHNLAFGAEARFTFAIFEAQAMALYNLNQSFNTYLDVGLCLDIAIISLGIGVGPNFVINFWSGAPAAAGFGFNGKAHVDLNLGSFKISVFYLLLVDSLNFPTFSQNLRLGNAGLALLFKL